VQSDHHEDNGLKILNRRDRFGPSRALL
jgi:hypothetical protein